MNRRLSLLYVKARINDRLNNFHHSDPAPLSESQVVDLLSGVTWSQSSFADAQTWSVLIYTHVDVDVPGKFNGSGSTWGIAVGVSGLAGTLFYDSEDTLLSAENDFYLVSVSLVLGGGGIVFVIDGNAVGFLALGGAGIDWAFSYGKFIWS